MGVILKTNSLLTLFDVDLTVSTVDFCLCSSRLGGSVPTVDVVVVVVLAPLTFVSTRFVCVLKTALIRLLLLPVVESALLVAFVNEAVTEAGDVSEESCEDGLLPLSLTIGNVSLRFLSTNSSLGFEAEKSPLEAFNKINK